MRKLLKSISHIRNIIRGKIPNLEYLTHPLTLPQGETEESLFSFLTNYHFPDEPREEIANYLREDFRRFLYTLQLVPAGRGRLLEIGANPYFTTMLLKKFTNYEVDCSNYFSPNHPKQDTQYKTDDKGQKIEFHYQHFNIEESEPPYPDEYFDVILCCEVIEHMTQDPLKALLNLKKKLKKEGCIILTTPNVARLENVARITAGENIYDPYSGYGPYGRHNREYNRHELHQLLTHAGFTIEEMFTADVHENRSNNYTNTEKILPLLQNREKDLGQYIFLKAKNTKEFNIKKPPWLYRSYPPQEIS